MTASFSLYKLTQRVLLIRTCMHTSIPNHSYISLETGIVKIFLLLLEDKQRHFSLIFNMPYKVLQLTSALVVVLRPFLYDE